jgi:hypothetical protein
VRYDFERNILLLGGQHFDIDKLKKACLSACGGHFTETYYRMIERIPLIDLINDLNLFIEYSKDQERLMKKK